MQVTVETLSSCPHLKVDEDGLHVLWTQDLLQRDHVILQNIQEKQLCDWLQSSNLFLNWMT